MGPDFVAETRKIMELREIAAAFLLAAPDPALGFGRRRIFEPAKGVRNRDAVDDLVDGGKRGTDHE
jgi:hypothetical protein